MDQSMKAFVERQNIVHFANLLKTETDPVKHAMVSRLLVDAEARQVKATEKD
jgi:hypothetical protein